MTEGFKFKKKELQFLAVTFPLFFLMGPFQTLTLLLNVWDIQWVVDETHPMDFHKLPATQVYDNFIGMPAIWLFTWTMYVGYTRGHFTSALEELIESIQQSKQKPKLKTTP